MELSLYSLINKWLIYLSVYIILLYYFNLKKYIIKCWVQAYTYVHSHRIYYNYICLKIVHFPPFIFFVSFSCTHTCFMHCRKYLVHYTYILPSSYSCNIRWVLYPCCISLLLPPLLLLLLLPFWWLYSTYVRVLLHYIATLGYIYQHILPASHMSFNTYCQSHMPTITYCQSHMPIITYCQSHMPIITYCQSHMSPSLLSHIANRICLLVSYHILPIAYAYYHILPIAYAYYHILPIAYAYHHILPIAYVS